LEGERKHGGLEKMLLYILRRLGLVLLTLLLTSIIIFTITQWLPGDVARVILGREAGEEAVQNLREELGLNEPLPMQYFKWLGNFIVGNWGTSFSTDSDIRPLVSDRIRNSFILAGVTLVIAVPLSVSLGVIAGLNENTLIDNLISISALSVVGLPEFVTGLILIQALAFDLNLLPASSTISPGQSFFANLPSLILPALTATLVLLAYVSRLVRSGVIEEIKKPYVRIATLKGLPYRTIIFKHILRNALLPTITVLAISFGWLISGLVVVENVFNYPGLGRLLVFAINRSDLPLIRAIVMVTVVGISFANLTADLLYGILNPQIRFGG
jgi:peptide/nickel transport system permease protein